MDEINLEYTDIIKAYQVKTTEFLNQIITAEAKLNASAAFINKLKERIVQLEEENKKIQKSSLKSTSKKSPVEQEETVIDYN
jgi:CII-binding regulator of phage lambda lysogenization HflD